MESCTKPLHTQQHRQWPGQLGNVAPERHDLELMAAGGTSLVGDNHLLLGHHEWITFIAMHIEPDAIEMPPSLGRVLHESIQILVFMANVAKPEPHMVAIALEGSLGSHGAANAT
jgi:hypothetical protein